MQLMLTQMGKVQVLREYPFKYKGFNAQKPSSDKRSEARFDEAMANPDNTILIWEEQQEYLDAKARGAAQEMRDNCLAECHDAIMAIVDNDNATTRAALEAHITELKSL